VPPIGWNWNWLLQCAWPGGSLDGWGAAAATAISVRRCEHWTLGVLAGFAGPIVALTGLDTCGVNLSGLTTSGKSTAQRLAASVWSTPDIRRPGLCQSARATDNAIEALAQRATGTVLSLDELAHVSGKAAAKMIYTIAGSVGKRRMTAEAAARDTYTWATFAILSSPTPRAQLTLFFESGSCSAALSVALACRARRSLRRTRR